MAKSKSRKEKHPLYHSWAWMRRMHSKFSVCDKWYNDFYSFVEDMGERPSTQHRVNRVDNTKGFSPSNCEWKEVIPCKDRAAYAREWRKQNPEKAKSNDLRRCYGIDIEQYNQMLEKQNHTCAICGGVEKFNNSLAVDHDHKTGKVRGLLCTSCNQGIGKLQDSVDVLQSAINYLTNCDK